MKKAIFVSALAALTLAGCKKAENTTVTEPETSTEAPAQISQNPINNQEDLVRAAKEKPLTTIAFAGISHDFGKVKKGESVQHVYEITNTGENPLVISAVQPGCGCTAPDYTKEPILPGKKGSITLHFDSSNFDGKVDKFADVYANVEETPIRLTFTADVQP